MDMSCVRPEDKLAALLSSFSLSLPPPLSLLALFLRVPLSVSFVLKRMCRCYKRGAWPPPPNTKRRRCRRGWGTSKSGWSVLLRGKDGGIARGHRRRGQILEGREGSQSTIYLNQSRQFRKRAHSLMLLKIQPRRECQKFFPTAAEATFGAASVCALRLGRPARALVLSTHAFL